MIKVYITDNEIKITGHAIPDICAAVSSAMYVTANNLLDMQLSGIDDGLCIIRDDVEDDYMVIKVKKASKINEILIKNLIQGLQDIADDSGGLVEIIKES